MILYLHLLWTQSVGVINKSLAGKKLFLMVSLLESLTGMQNFHHAS